MYQHRRIYKLVDGNTNAILLAESSTVGLRQKISELKAHDNKHKIANKYKDIYERQHALMASYRQPTTINLKQSQNVSLF